MSKVTITEIAQLLGISVSTVSRALNDSHEISEATKEKVLTLARQLNYSPNVIANSLRTHKSMTIAVVIPVITNSFFSEVVSGIEEIAKQNNFHLLIYLTNYDVAREVFLSRLLMGGRVDGVLMSVSSTNELKESVEELKKRNIPVVLFDNVTNKIETFKLTTNNTEITYRATRLLIEQGCKRITYLSFPTIAETDFRRKEGYLKAVKEYGLESNVVRCEAEDKVTFKQIYELLNAENKPDGIFSCMERLAITLYQVCNKLKINIPTDLKVISFANLNAATVFDPSLTTIMQPAYQIGVKACEALLVAINKGIAMRIRRR